MTVPPVVDVVNPMPVVEPEQIVCEGGVAMTVDTGFTVISTVTGVPLQEPNAGVIVYRTTAGEFVLLFRVCAMLLPLPLENPVAVPPVNAVVQE